MNYFHHLIGFPLNHPRLMSTLSYDELSVESLSYDELSAESLSYDELSAKSLSYDELSTESLSYDELSVESLSYDELSAESLSYDELSVGNSICAEPPRLIYSLRISVLHIYAPSFLEGLCSSPILEEHSPSILTGPIH
ncbi:hypothetical protein ABEY24_15610 [Peribacillus frigoritolerans]|uniref:hypothetical protein n=1 Tax=Peribacillus frigoritolerans TaxID=450367 RepID=UPI003D2C46EA